MPETCVLVYVFNCIHILIVYVNIYSSIWVCFLFNNKKQFVLCWKTNKSLIFVAIAFLVNLNEDVLEVEGSPLFRSWIFLRLLCIVWQLWSRLMEIFLLLRHVFIVWRHIPLELYRFFASTYYWRKRCYMSFWRQQNVDTKDVYEFLAST